MARRAYRIVPVEAGRDNLELPRKPSGAVRVRRAADDVAPAPASIPLFSIPLKKPLCRGVSCFSPFRGHLETGSRRRQPWLVFENFDGRAAARFADHDFDSDARAGGSSGN